MRAFLKQCDLYDVAGIGVVSLLLYSTALIYRPAAYLMAGVILLRIAMRPIQARRKP